MNRMLTACLSTAAAAVLTATIAMPAEALHVRPSKALMRDASGATNGCVVEIPTITADSGSVIIPLQITTCPAGSDVHRSVYTAGVWEVMPDKSLREVVAYDRYAISASDQATIGPDFFNMFLDCSDPTIAGTHTWLVRARINAKHTQNNSDPNPFWAKVDRKQTVTC